MRLDDDSWAARTQELTRGSLQQLVHASEWEQQ